MVTLGSVGLCDTLIIHSLRNLRASLFAKASMGSRGAADQSTERIMQRTNDVVVDTIECYSSKTTAVRHKGTSHKTHLIAMTITIIIIIIIIVYYYAEAALTHKIDYTVRKNNKKALLSQRRPRDAPNIRVP